MKEKREEEKERARNGEKKVKIPVQFCHFWLLASVHSTYNATKATGFSVKILPFVHHFLSFCIFIYSLYDVSACSTWSALLLLHSIRLLIILQFSRFIIVIAIVLMVFYIVSVVVSMCLYVY